MKNLTQAQIEDIVWKVTMVVIPDDGGYEKSGIAAAIAAQVAAAILEKQRGA